MTVSNIVIDLSEEIVEQRIEDLSISCQDVVIESAPGAPQAPIGCGPTKYSGDSINLQASPNDAIGPYYVRFWRKPNAVGTMAWGEIGTVRNVSEGSSTSTSFTLYDADLVAAVGHGGALTPDSDTAGNITESGAANALAIGKIRVATTVYDSCPVTPQVCLSYCDISLGCVAPTCNFTVL